MSDRPGREQHMGREIPEPSAEIKIEMHRLSVERGLDREGVPEVAERSSQDVREVTKASLRFRSIDEAIASGVDRKWAEIGTRTEAYLAVGERLDFDVDGHRISASRSDIGVTFQIDGQGQESEASRDFLLHSSSAFSTALRRELEEREREREIEAERRFLHQGDKTYSVSYSDAEFREYQRQEAERRRLRDEMTRLERGNNRAMDREEGIER